MITPVKGKIALVTGGGRGIGRGAALALAKYGAKVVVTARSTDEIEAVAKEIRAMGGEALAIAGDVSNYADVQRIVSTTVKTFGAIDILINNAALLGEVNKLELTDPEAWQMAQQVNVMGAYYTIRETLGAMIANRYGRIVNVTSGAASGLPRMSAYSVSKAALDVITTVVAQEAQGTGVCVVGISPGTVNTIMQAEVRNLPKGRLEDNMYEYFQNAKANNQLSDPLDVGEQIAAVVMTDRTNEIINVYEIHDELSNILLKVNSLQ